MTDNSTSQIKNVLRSMDLGEKEISIYMSLLLIGTNPASVIAKQANLNRVTCYQLLEKLIQRGFVDEIVQKNITWFSAVKPQYIIHQLNNKKEELEYNIEKLKQATEKMETHQQNLNNKPKVTFHEGTAAIQNLMEDTLSSPDQLLRAYTSVEELEALLPEYFTDYYSRRAKKGVRVQAIYPASVQSWQHKSRDHIEMRESRLVPPEFNFHLDIFIYGNKVVIASIREKFAVLMESKDMSDSQKRIFDIIWKATEKYDKLMTKLFQTNPMAGRK